LRASARAARLPRRKRGEALPELAAALAASYDFSRHRRVLDVGGGTGSFLIAVLRRHSALQARCSSYRAPARLPANASLVSQSGRESRLSRETSQTYHHVGNDFECARRNGGLFREFGDTRGACRKALEQTDFVRCEKMLCGHKAHSDLHDGIGREVSHM
jgi:hypothetical protein